MSSVAESTFFIFQLNQRSLFVVVQINACKCCHKF